MTRRAFFSLYVGCLIVPALAVANARPTSPLDDPAQSKLWIKELGSDDAAVRKAAADKLATIEAIPLLMDAIRGAENAVSGRAAEILVAVLDADQAELAAAAELAVAELEKSTDQGIAGRMRTLLERRDEAAAEKLESLGALVRGRDGKRRVQIINGRWKGGDEGLSYVRRLRCTVTISVSFGDEPTVLRGDWQGPFGRSVASWMSMGDARPITLRGLAALCGLSNVESLSLLMLPASDDLAPLSELPSLQRLSLDLSGGNVENALIQVAKLDKLESLGLFNAPDLGQQLEKCAAITALKSLTIHFSDGAETRGLASLAKLPQLESLGLVNAYDLGSQLSALAEQADASHCHGACSSGLLGQRPARRCAEYRHDAAETNRDRSGTTGIRRPGRPRVSPERTHGCGDLYQPERQPGILRG